MNRSYYNNFERRTTLVVGIYHQVDWSCSKLHYRKSTCFLPHRQLLWRYGKSRV